ncbi:PDR/VanB family oxidoreductase [Paraburkholderia sartisoli]|uniref:Ferredoxin--NADP+ reductase n=1 Tax=Paraburkholderia sartisoli TaxID=83784 RepID=A0A1H4GRZ3_9BURK|nr:PDR/VanB family oxidoreductase [Paraburkholderia sartisoli]SEB12111.1 ferredoxin--NADP+ reductase [Paraburkholderia sartisoli]
MLRLRVSSIVQETPSIKTFRLVEPDKRPLPAFSAGSHIVLHLTDDLSRSYSLLNSEEDRHVYEIGVACQSDSTGGSKYIHDHLAINDLLAVDEPINSFELARESDNTVLFCGGIGITPMLSMADRLCRSGARWTLVYCARSKASAAYLDRLAAYGNHVHLHFDDVAGGIYDIQSVVDSSPDTTHFYCCGPSPMIEAFRKATSALPLSRVHLESFVTAQSRDHTEGFVVELARSRKVVSVPPGSTILESLRKQGIPVSFSCEQGSCGACETKVLEGRPDHRDGILSERERKAGKTMMICCSGCIGDRLVLDL